MSKEEWLAQREKKLQQERAEETAVAQAIKAPPPPTMTRPKRLGRESDDDNMPPAPSKPKTPARPQDVAEWKPNDFFGAQQDGDPRLTAAVRHLAEHSAGKQDAAELFAKLLESPTDLSETVGTGRREMDTNPGFTEAVVAALAANGAPVARQTLERLVAGTLKTAHPQVAANAALKALLARDCPENDDLLFRVITAPDRPARGGQAEIDPQKLRPTAIALMDATASETLRVRLAKEMTAPEISAALYDRLWTCLRETRPENLAAQIVLYQSNRLDQTAQCWLEERFVDQGGEVLRRLLGVPAPRQRDAACAKSAMMTDPYHLAEILWSPDFTVAIERRLRVLDTLSSEMRLVTLASTIPSPSLRGALLRVLQRHWDEGPKALEPLGASEGVTVEPGFVVLAKMLLRKDAIANVADRDIRGGDIRPSGFAGKPVRMVEMRKVKPLQDETSQRWMNFSGSVVCTMCRRLCSAAQAEQTTGAQTELTDNVQFPVKLYPNADVVAVYRLEWPDGLSGKIATAPSLHVRYVRLEMKARPTRLLAYYRRQLSDCVEHEIYGGRWLDSLIAEKDQAGVRSIDVVLAKASPNVLGLPDQEQELTVDILAIECEVVARKSSVSASR